MRLTLLLLALLGLAATASLLVGSASLGDPALRGLLLDLRGTRTVLAALAGAGLAVAGAMMQGLFRNPLASPSVLGTGAGATLGGQLALLLHAALAARLPVWLAPEMSLPLGCLLGAGIALILALGIAGRGAGTVALLLAGFVLSALFAGLGAAAVVLAEGSWELGRTMVAFTLGGIDGKGWRHAALAAPLVLAGCGAAWAWARPLDLALSGESEAASLGVDVPRLVRWTLVWTAMLVAGATAIGGGVGFVGLLVPHALRPFTGAAHARLVPASALGGAAFLIACDVAARAVPVPGGLPLGVITALIGAPLFLILLRRGVRAEQA